ncbi:hypothetical protein Fmac_029833 [Flemingia macrophylla]|uniref:Uncharacterized protein n=1 Tax=Flemingia macrophylla TaxID=520843 RepID=A0ABD1LBF9_9FABA
MLRIPLRHFHAQDNGNSFDIFVIVQFRRLHAFCCSVCRLHARRNSQKTSTCLESIITMLLSLESLSVSFYQ